MGVVVLERILINGSYFTINLNLVEGKSQINDSGPKLLVDTEPFTAGRIRTGGLFVYLNVFRGLLSDFLTNVQSSSCKITYLFDIIISIIRNIVHLPRNNFSRTIPKTCTRKLFQLVVFHSYDRYLQTRIHIFVSTVLEYLNYLCKKIYKN